MEKKISQDKVKITPTYGHHWVWLVFWAVLLLTCAIRVRLLAVPLERDEGEYAYAGQLILQGIPPYEIAYNMKMPGIYAAYAMVLAIFGQTHIGIHLGLLFINIAAVAMVFLLARELFDTITGLFAAAAFALFSVGISVQGVFANAEHFVLLPAVAGILLLYKTVNSNKYLTIFLAGLLLGLAFMMKQHGAAFIVFAGSYIFFRELRRRPFNWKLFTGRTILFSTGVFLPFILTCFILWRLGVFERFWFWTFDYARQYVSMVPFYIGLEPLVENTIAIVTSAVCLWAMSGLGLIYLLCSSRFSGRRLFVLGFLVFSFLSVCPGFYFREHYFVLLLPAGALLSGVGIAAIYEISASARWSFVARFAPGILSVVIFASAFCQQYDFFFIDSPTTVSRAAYGRSPFPEALKIARFLKENSQKNDTVAVIGSEPEIVFYSDRRSATGYIYTYSLMEDQPYAEKMQEEMIQQIERAAPKFLVVVGTPTSWFTQLGPDSGKKLTQLFERCPFKDYNQVGLADIISNQTTVYCWGKYASAYSLRSDSWLTVMRHKRYGDTNNILWQVQP